MPRYKRLAWFAVGSAVACGGPHFDGRMYRDNNLAFRVGPVPKRWRALEVDHALVAFRDDDTGATVAINGRCGKDGDDVPLTSLTHHLFLHFTHREVKGQSEIQLDHRAALRTELVAKLDGVPKRFVVYVLKKDGCVYDFMFIADVNTRSGSQDFDRFVNGFTTI